MTHRKRCRLPHEPLKPRAKWESPGSKHVVELGAAPSDPFDFSVDHWNDQLVAGYSKTRPNSGLKAHMPDYNDLKRPPGVER